ncbi:M23 family metallopeptidase [Curtobacterium flaccumfaciens]|nr:M23 family metallopeptidase [Curtobacterium flaccumfaciens]
MLDQPPGARLRGAHGYRGRRRHVRARGVRRVFGGYGNQVLLQHADGSQTRYGHLSQIGVRGGQTVTAGQRIGAVGNTGVSTGAHLHFEVIVGGTPVDPAVWLRNRGLL